MTNGRKSVVVVGGGLAGLTSAVGLSSRGYDVTLLEARGRLGGRTIGIEVERLGTTVDNGQHGMLRCYHRLIEYLTEIGTADQVHWTTTWVQREPGRGPVRMTPQSMLTSGAVPLREVPAAIRTLASLARALVRVPARLDDLSVDEWLRRIRAPQSLRRLFFDPFVISLNDTPARFSAHTFVQTLREFLVRSLRDPRNLGLGYATTDLHSLFVAPAEDLLRTRGAVVRPRAGVSRVRIQDGRIVGVVLNDGEELQADAVVLALPAWDCAKVLEASDIGHPDFVAGPAGIEASPIVSTYVWLDRPLEMTQSFEGLLGTTSEWIFDRTALYGQRDKPGYGYSLVTSAAWAPQEQSRDEVVAGVMASLATHFPEFGDRTVLDVHVVRQPRATFSPLPGSARLRRPARTPVDGLVLAGDWTSVGVSSLMEGAVESGRRAVDEIEAQLVRETRLARSAGAEAATTPVG